MADLFDFYGADEITPEMSAIYAAYREWDALNPHFYPLFCRFAVQLAERGHRHISSKLIFERVRWESLIKTVGDDYKLNNNYTALYARRFMRDHPQYEGFFRTRELKAVTATEAKAA